MKASTLAIIAGLLPVAIATSCSHASSPSAVPPATQTIAANTCHVGANATRTRLNLTNTTPQPRITAAVGDVIDVSARWGATFAAPHAIPSTAVCEFKATSGPTATADLVLRREGRITFVTSDAVATDTMDPVMSGRVQVRDR